MPKENDATFRAQKLAAELNVLQQELNTFTKDFTGQIDNNDAVWVFRLFQGISCQEWEQLSQRHELDQWLTLPINGSAYPYLKLFQQTLERLAYQTDHDALTGLANRRAFNRSLDIEIERSRRAKTPLSLAMFDLDDFKIVNDTYGHVVGDKVLMRFARHLRDSTRRYDLPARLGGEEFALIMAGSGLVKAKNLLTRLLAEFAEIEFTDPDKEKTFQVTCSVGLTCYKGTVDISDKDLLALADEALYKAKASGKAQVQVSRLHFTENVPDETLVHANEKQFLFGGKPRR